MTEEQEISGEFIGGLIDGLVRVDFFPVQHDFSVAEFEQFIRYSELPMTEWLDSLKLMNVPHEEISRVAALESAGEFYICVKVSAIPLSTLLALKLLRKMPQKQK